jgi:hypothetical protein
MSSEELEHSKVFNMDRVTVFPLCDRANKVSVTGPVEEFDSELVAGTTPDKVTKAAHYISLASEEDAPIIFGFGAHLVKTLASGHLIDIMQEGFASHLLTNGAGSIHDWELAFIGQTSESVEDTIHEGTFGMSEETAEGMNRAISMNGHQIGWGAAIGQHITTSAGGFPHSQHSLQGAAYNRDIPFSVGVSIGQDILHMHPSFSPSCAGAASHIDFRKLINTLVEGPEDAAATIVCMGSAVAVPMIVEKAFSVACNVRKMPTPNVFIVDIQTPPDFSESESSTGYYNRPMKTFSRIAGQGDVTYIQMSHLSFLRHLSVSLLGYCT